LENLWVETSKVGLAAGSPLRWGFVALHFLDQFEDEVVEQIGEEELLTPTGDGRLGPVVEGGDGPLDRRLACQEEPGVSVPGPGIEEYAAFGDHQEVQVGVPLPHGADDSGEHPAPVGPLAPATSPGFRPPGHITGG